ncbi:PssE/Cps14G family polysaccharide biosynthesis glycosyltransferase [Eisenbergiella porci]|uniref:PssE/Cps14G family polysaccharide biosynthesis glycosyltransferase n=1 Tax=Eisenbergiella porci TaxID=2652274 RepID=UPI0022E22791|nr:PssE/Cps14G family polysaccharide biosynthesis glycosyltransferase [Eisenbergiella porci]
MIFVTLGSQKFQFNRLLEKIDALIEEKVITDEVFAQIGYSDYHPKNYQYKDFLNRDEFALMEGKADIVITHGGTGAIIGAVKKGKKVIAVPRMAKYGEHVDDHQIQLIEQFHDMELIYSCSDVQELKTAIEEIQTKKYNEYHSNTAVIIDSIEKFLADIQ